MEAKLKLNDAEVLKRLLRKRGLWTDKDLGQHFLVSASAVESIVGAVSHCRSALEIGPGPGVLTQPLSEQLERVLALELDTKYVRFLAESAPKAQAIQGDALTADLAAILRDLPRPCAIVSNLPYYITSPLLQRVADVREHIDIAVLMMQREVASRLAARAGNADRGSLSIYLQAQVTIQGVCDVPASAFMPPPKVDSRVLSFVPTGTELPEDVTRLVKLGFAQPRKTLANNLSTGLKRTRDEVSDCLEAMGFNEKTRAHELTQEQWQALAARLAE